MINVYDLEKVHRELGLLEERGQKNPYDLLSRFIRAKTSIKGITGQKDSTIYFNNKRKMRK